jgi:hypothetical protein
VQQARGRGNCHYFLRVVVERVDFVDAQHCVVAAPRRLAGKDVRDAARKRTAFSQLFLRWSRACLGKMMNFLH